MPSFPCPCCGHLTLELGPGDYDLCRVCFWEDDPDQLRFPESPRGANGYSLIEGQRTYSETGTSHAAFSSKVRAALAEEPIDSGWRMVDPERDGYEREEGALRVADDFDLARLYWWRSTYWRKEAPNST
ncbi:CPCC family cysteine-rich protein [Frondihabitans cladoniiphilus]|uniref:Cysteine-rich CPCC domain-containing protein n=1 Tax=Frondihabitans cladoniiphilus TaxID=715785 RepID=A0ABP8VMS3_9MICO